MPFMDKLPSLDSLKALEWTTWISLYIPGLIVAVVNGKSIFLS